MGCVYLCVGCHFELLNCIPLLKKEIEFKSQHSFFFYFFFGFFLTVSGFALYRLITGDLDLLSFMFLVLLSFIIGYIFSFRFDCRITLDSNHLKFKYIIPFRKTILINTDKIVEIDKHEDNPKRYHKKIYIKTISKNFLVRYNTSEISDEKFIEILLKVISK